jgi:hypothetical protein
MASSILTKPGFLIGLTNLFAIAGSTYHVQNKIAYNLEEQEARFDELEGTLRGHIGLIEEALDRLEAKIGSGGRGKGGLESREIYESRQRDAKK